MEIFGLLLIIANISLIAFAYVEIDIKRQIGQIEPDCNKTSSPLPGCGRRDT